MTPRLRLWIGLVAAWCLLTGAGSVATDDAWELLEETMSGNEAPRLAVVAQFPSMEACQNRAMELSAGQDHAPDAVPAGGAPRRLGFTCLPASPPARAPAQR